MKTIVVVITGERDFESPLAVCPDQKTAEQLIAGLDTDHEDFKNPYIEIVPWVDSPEVFPVALEWIRRKWES